MMIRKLKSLVRERQERGAILVIAAGSLVLLMAMAAFAVDYGWIAYNRLEVRKTAEAAALAGVVHMPLPGSTTFGPGTQPYDAAIDTATRNGYTNGVDGATVVPVETPSPQQVRVDVTDQVPTFFMRLFIGDTVTVTGHAVAEQLPPLKIGSDEANLGGPSESMWVAINGERRRKASGDPFSTRCDDSNSRCSVSPTGSLNPEFRDPAYFYAVEVPAGQTGTLDVQIYDGTHLDRGDTDIETGEYNTDNDDWSLTFDLYAPDTTPNDWVDNSQRPGATPVCSRTFYRDGQHGQPVGYGLNAWVSLSGCGAATSGIYVLEVSVDGFDSSVSAFAMRARVGGTTNVAVYGLGAMSLWMNEDDSNPTFKIVRLDEIYAGTELELGLFDPGDVTGLGHLQFTGALAGIECLVQVTDQNGNVGPWQTDGALNPDGDWAGGNCGITSSQSGNARIYNGDWLAIRFVIPPDYTCSGAACWSYVDYAFDDSPFDRTTWTAQINGTPIHLEP
jgi:hypothetical protein